MGLALDWREDEDGGQSLIWNLTLVLGQKGIHHQGTPHQRLMTPQGLVFMMLLKKEPIYF